MLQTTRARVRVIPALAGGAAAGMAWGVAVRAWMRLISEDPEFTWSGTIFIVMASTFAGFGAALAATARSNRWRLGKVASVVGGVLFFGLGMGAGSIMLISVILIGVAVGRPRIAFVVRLAIVALAGLVGFSMLGVSPAVAAGMTAVVGVPLLAGWRTRLVLTVLGLIPVVLVMWGVLTSELPLWQRLAGTAAYPLLVVPVLVWFSRTVAPFPAEGGSGRSAR